MMSSVGRIKQLYRIENALFHSAKRLFSNITRPYRSVLYTPASIPSALERVESLPTDAIIFDLEDAVLPDLKDTARDNLMLALKKNEYQNRTRIIRINGLNTPWGYDDVHAISSARSKSFDAVLLPKTESTDDVDELAKFISPKPIWTMIETPLGVLNSASIAAHKAVEGLVMGTNDLAKELNCKSRDALITSLQMCLLSARAHRKLCIDGAYVNFFDDVGLRKECEQGREWGFDGKTLIHPNQLSVTNQEFKPKIEEISLARRQIDAFEEAKKDGKVAVVDGALVENLHIDSARRLLAITEIIQKIEEYPDYPDNQVANRSKTNIIQKIEEYPYCSDIQKTKRSEISVQ